MQAARRRRSKPISPAVREPRGDQILHHLVLAVDGDRATAGELAQRDAVALALELQVDAVVDEPFAVHPLADAERAQQIDRSLLEHAGAQSALDVRAVATLDDDRVDAVACEQTCASMSPAGPAPMIATCVRSAVNTCSVFRPAVVVWMISINEKGTAI